MNILCMFANVQNLKMVFVMSSRTEPVAAARLCHSGSRRPVLLTLPVAVRCVGRCWCLLAVLLPAVARCCKLITEPKVSDRQMIILKKCACQCVRVWLVREVVCLVREVKGNLFGCDVWGYHRERTRAPSRT